MSIISRGRLYFKKSNMGNDNFFREMVALISDITWEFDENWRYTSLSGKLREFIGYTAEELIGKSIFSIMSESEAKKFLNLLSRKSSLKENITDLEIRVLNKKKQVHYLLINGIPVIDGEKKFRGYRGIVRDITDKKLIEAALNESKGHLSTLMSNLPGMAYRGSFKNGFRMNFVSDGVYHLTGYNAADFIEKKISPGIIIHQDDINMVKTIIRNALNDKRQYEVIFRIITADSKIKWIMDKGFGIYRDGVLNGIEGFSVDITETREAIEFGKINERRFKNLFESNPQGIAIADKSGHILQANRTWKKMFGYSDDDMHRLHIMNFRMEQDRETDLHLLNSIFKGDTKYYRIERMFIKKNGENFWCDLSATLIEDPDEKDTYVIGLYSDITERKKIENELKKFREELESLVQERTEEINRLTLKVINSQEEERQRIARDLHDGVGQTILAAKYAFNSFIKGNKKDNKFLDRGKALIDIASQELREVYTGIYPSMLKELGLNTTINWLIKNSLDISDLGVTYLYTLKKELSPNLSLNIYRMIQELFNNIVKHSEADHAKVALNQAGEAILLEVSDNGKGFNIQNTIKTSAGSGLINIRQRVEYLKGHLEIESKPGKTVIRIELPLRES